MAIDGKLLARARARKDEIRRENALEEERRRAAVYAAVPAVKEKDNELRQLLAGIVSTAAKPDGSGVDGSGLEQRILSICADKAELLTAAGYPSDWLDGVYACPTCRDSGFLEDGTLCGCVLALYEEERAKRLATLMKNSEDCFADFSLDWYPATARETMALVLSTCRRYVETFGPGTANLLFQGGTGLGKTFLSGCVAKAVSEAGFSVDYRTVTDALAVFERQKFSRDHEEADTYVEKILSCDLLVLDDLGTELLTGFAQSALYQIVNTRLVSGKKTIISTNLSDGALAERYLPQTVSRLKGEYDEVPFVGEDIRALKKRLR